VARASDDDEDYCSVGRIQNVAVALCCLFCDTRPCDKIEDDVGPPKARTRQKPKSQDQYLLRYHLYQSFTDDGKKALISYKYPYIDQILPLPQHNNILTLQIRNDHLRVM